MNEISRRLIITLHGSVLMAVLAFPLSGQTCNYQVTPQLFAADAAGDTFRVDVRSTPTSCAWSAQSNVRWITRSFGGPPENPSTGNGSAGFTVERNRDASQRSGTVTVAGQRITVNQAAANCPFTLDPATAIVSATGANGTFRVQTSCNWTAVSRTPWIRLTSGTSGTGNGTVAYSVAANDTGATRTGSIQVGTAEFRISQPSDVCAVTLDPPQANFTAAGGNGALRVTAGCSWTAVSQAPWLRITGSASGNVNGQITYIVDPNNTLTPRMAGIMVGNQTFTATQAAATCVITVAPADVTVPAAGGNAEVVVTSGCAWTAATSDPWLRVIAGQSGSGDGRVGISAAANTGDPRVGSVVVGTQTVVVRQAGGACQITLSPASTDVASRGGEGTLLVAAGSECQWAIQAPDWIRVTPAAGTGNTVVRYTAAANLTGAARSGAVTIGAQVFTLRQVAANPTFTAAGVAHAASFVAGSVAPGLIITIFGTEIGPEQLLLGRLNDEGTGLVTQLEGTRVLIDSVASPLVYVSGTQLSAVVPYGVAGRASVPIVIEARGARSREVAVPVVAATPGIFTLSANGAGPAAVLNQDNSVNLASNPAVAGSVVQIFATGGGVLDPPGTDGALTTAVASVTVPVSVEIGGQPAEVLYAGAAPGLVSGVIQVNARIAPGAGAGDAIPVFIRMGSFGSQTTATIAVR